MKTWRPALVGVSLLALTTGMVSTSSAAPVTNTAASTIGAALVEFSTDQATWTRNPPPIFAPTFRIVPGDQVTGVRYVRNMTNTPVTVGVSVLKAVTAGGSLSSANDFRVSVAADASSTWASAMAACRPVLSRVLGPQEVLAVPVNVALPWSSGPVSENHAVDVPLYVSALQGSMPEVVAFCPEPASSPVEPTTPATGTTVVAGRAAAMHPPATPSRVETGSWWLVRIVSLGDLIAVAPFLLGLAIFRFMMVARRRRDGAHTKAAT